MAQDNGPVRAGFWLSDEQFARRIARSQDIMRTAVQLEEHFDVMLQEDEPGQEKAWDAYRSRLLASLASAKRAVFAVFGCDPRKSALFETYPDILTRACDPQTPVIYHPDDRSFALMETWGPAEIALTHCPWTGKTLPRALFAEWEAEVNAIMGGTNWSPQDTAGRLPETLRTEAWWIDKGF